MNIVKFTQPPKVGDFVTVEKWINGIKDRSFCGDVLQIKAINMPFFVVRNLSTKCISSAIILSFDEVQVMPLTKEYVDAALEKH